MCSDIPVRDEYRVLNGLRLHYRDWGWAGGAPLIMLHGFTMHAHDWDTVAAALADEYRVLALDQRGHGESDWAAGYDPDSWLEDIEALVNDLGLDRFSLLGHSSGAVNAYMYAARQPNRVARLIIEDFGPLPETAAEVPAQELFDDPEDFVRLVLPMDPDAREEEWRRHVVHTLVQRPDGRWVRRWDPVFRGANPPRTRPEVEAQWAALGSISCPTLVLRGERSPFPETIARQVAEVLPRGEYVEIPGSRHSIHWANTAGFLSTVREFLATDAR